MIEGALDGRVALVTGASRGIGRAAAETLAWAGARVVMVARSGEALADLAVRVGGHPVPADVSSPAEVEALVARVTDAAGAPPPRFWFTRRAHSPSPRSSTPNRRNSSGSCALT